MGRTMSGAWVVIVHTTDGDYLPYGPLDHDEAVALAQKIEAEEDELLGVEPRGLLPWIPNPPGSNPPLHVVEPDE